MFSTRQAKRQNEKDFVERKQNKTKQNKTKGGGRAGVLRFWCWSLNYSVFPARAVYK